MKNSTFYRQLALLTATAILTACAGTGHEQSRNSTPTEAAVTRDDSPVRREAELARTPTRHNDAAEHGATRQKLSAPSHSALSVDYCCPRSATEELDRENYASFQDNALRLASQDPVSTFSIDVDTGSYSNIRRFLTGGQLPPRDAVRVEEMINYFSYDYATPGTMDTPFNVVTKLAQTPWNPGTMLLHVGLKGFEVANDVRPPANLVFLVDVSGSMRSANKLPLLKDALKMLTRNLDARDSVAIAGYAGGAGLILEPTSGADKQRIVDALDNMNAAGRTNGAAGIHLAYELAQRGFIRDGINRVILATDGDFNVGTVNFEALVDLVERKRNDGVALSTLGFGTGNYNDKLLEQIADAGNGNYSYIDNRREARKVLVEEMSSTLQTIAKDVKIQIEFNPATVAEYRLIGYENRMLNREDFNNDEVDAGEIGAGHTVTALYEITPAGSPAQLNDPLRYGSQAGQVQSGDSELAFVRLRFKLPEASESQLIERVVTRHDISRMDGDFRFATAVAAFGQRLRGGSYLNGFDMPQIADLAAGARGRDHHGYRAEFVELVGQAIEMDESIAELRGGQHPYHIAN